HEVLRRAGELRRAGKSVTAAALRSIHSEVWRTVPFPDPRRAAAFRRNGAAELEAFRARGGFEGEPAYLEQPFEVAVDGWNLRGVIDRIDHTEARWKIIDYKSGRPIARRKRDLQVALYALGASAAMQLEPLDLEVVYLASGESVQVGNAAGLVREAEAQGTEVADGIRAGRFPAKPERRRCRLCPYRLACSDAL
ncbi:MAG TPA: PD-(D/E)XK nuclease family protein, partial [Candidatus Dormibacteraeota bacterium]|nr:PD-(D/E)XK nuclease family protein [Candidatus Dormibacteraeota bacterium]